ncbi:sigma-70 family RNA polymerase sigma factor [Lysinibacillus fusiformis]
MEDFRKWIGMIAKYKAIDLYRTLDKRQQREAQLEAASDAPAMTDVQQTFLNREERHELLFELSKLEEIDRDIFIMKYFLEMANGAIADMLGLSKAAIDNRLYRGKKKLAQSLVLKERFI